MIKITSLTISLVAVLLLNTVNVSAEIEFPKIKYGEWETTTTTQGMQIPGMPGTQKIVSCIDEKQLSEHLSQTKSLNMPGCEQPVLSQKGKSISASVDCNVQGMKMSVSSLTEVINETETKTVVKSQMGPGMNMTINVNGRYTGPCRNGMKPGDYKTVK